MNELMKKKVLVIAEAGVNHNGNLETAKRLVDAAVEARADAVKFQTFKAEKIVTKTAQKAAYQRKDETMNESQFHMLKKLELTDEDHRTLFEYCEKKGIMFMSTPFDVDSVDLLEKLGVRAYKIGSGEITNKPLIKYIAGKKKSIILSTGMASLEEIEEAISWIREEGTEEISLLHCTTNYPTNYEDVHLNTMALMRSTFNLPIGYSDHTRGIEVSIAAVALGACIIEKHFTLDRKMEGPDHKASLEPSELKNMISAIRNVEKAFGLSLKHCNPSEIENINIVRKSIVADKDIDAGDVLTMACLAIKRPGFGIAPKFLDKVIGMRANKKIMKDEVIRWEDLNEK